MYRKSHEDTTEQQNSWPDGFRQRVRNALHPLVISVTTLWQSAAMTRAPTRNYLVGKVDVQPENRYELCKLCDWGTDTADATRPPRPQMSWQHRCHNMDEPLDRRNGMYRR